MPVLKNPDKIFLVAMVIICALLMVERKPYCNGLPTIRAQATARLYAALKVRIAWVDCFLFFQLKT